MSVAPESPCASSCCPALTLLEILEQYRCEAVTGSCHIGRYRCRYYSWGSGPPLLFIPGLCDDALSFVMPIALLKDDFRCIAYDLPAGPEIKKYRHADYIADVAALVDHLGLAECNLFGSSFGSTMALAALARWPARFPRAVLQGGFAQRPLGAGEVCLASLARYWPWPLRYLPLREAVLYRAHFATFRDCAPENWEYFLDHQGEPPMSAVAHRALTVHRLDLRQLLPAIRQPVLMICGEFDHLVGKQCEDVLLRGLPRVERVELGGAGHMPHFSHPALLAEAIRGFCEAGVSGT